MKVKGKELKFKVFSKCSNVGEKCVCVCFWVFHKHRWECKVLMEPNLLILISTENPQYFKYISDKNTSHHILKSSNGQTKEFVLKTKNFWIRLLQKVVCACSLSGRRWKSYSNSFEWISVFRLLVFSFEHCFNKNCFYSLSNFVFGEPIFQS